MTQNFNLTTKLYFNKKPQSNLHKSTIDSQSLSKSNLYKSTINSQSLSSLPQVFIQFYSI